MMRRKTQRPEQLNRLLDKVIGRLEKKCPDNKEKILNVWRKSVGEKAYTHSRPVSLRKKTLTIEIDSSAWLYALNLKKKDILVDIKKALGEDKVSNIRFRMGEIA